LGRLRDLSAGFQADGEDIASQFIAVAIEDSAGAGNVKHLGTAIKVGQDFSVTCLNDAVFQDVEVDF